MHRYFQTSREVYDTARLSLDAAFGHPNGRAETCLPPEPPVASGDTVYLALPSEMAAWPEVEPLLAGLLADGQAVEIAEGEYQAVMPQEEP